MARSAKDLRDFICVSRLTIRDSDEELSDNELGLPDSFSSLSLDDRPDTASRYNSKSDSFLPNGNGFQPRPPSKTRPRSTGAKPKKKITKQDNHYPSLVTSPMLQKLDFPHVKVPLPPVGSRGNSKPSSSNTSSSDGSPKGAMAGYSPTTKQGNVDHILQYLDENIVAQWLLRANQMVNEISMWCNSSDNYIHFANFWLKDFPENQRTQIFNLEVSILYDEMSVAFSDGIKTGEVKDSDLNHILMAVFREYPEKLCSSKGPYLFLNILDTLSSEKKDDYKKLLSDIKISTRNKEYAQMMLATRAFALMNVWYAVINFYRTIQSGSSMVGDDVAEGEQSTKKDVANITSERGFKAVQYGYMEFLYYLMKCKKLSPLDKDCHDRTLIFTAVMHNQSVVLKFLLTKVQPRIDVNAASDTGNTPLHAAANQGYVNIVELLIQRGRANVNATNPQCEGATPLHLAVMHGHKEVCDALIKGNADVHAKMGDLTPLEMATDMGHDQILALLMLSLPQEGAVQDSDITDTA
ncbi:uncharacterized protein LOC100377359 [Saccoglossus kowalevskii]|uniref:Uncharacterized protein LOC100377359 n=1 Tax=Saccoglossus kowalevskii TaxID=10224 RepID=A0ABM0GJG2_SACKO|nr:PREDICTED: uncharacterized protein LOC100377359 [Saccoglossus kowalevskii]